MEWRAHSEKQERALFSERPITVVATGIQWGKTSVGAVRSKIALHTHTEATDNFLVVAPTYKIMQQSTLPPFLRMMIGCGEYRKADGEFKVHGGGTVYFRTGTDPDSIVGITNVRAVWGDEAGLFSLYFWENLQARASFREAPITLTTSPYTLNWLYKEIIRPLQRNAGSRPDVELVQAASNENPHFPKSEFERRKLTMDPRRFKAMYGGEWEKPAGLVYDCFDEDENQCEPFALPTGTRYYGGIDWGFNHPFVFKVRAVTPAGRHYGVSEFCKGGLTISDVVAVVKQRCQVYGVGPVYCDPAQPAHIEELCRAGVRAIAADNDIRIGVDRHYELLKTRTLKYFRGSNPHTLDEIESYHYPEPEDLDTDDDAKDVLPVKQNDDCMDCDRYISISTFRVGEKRQPLVPGDAAKQEGQHDRIERLKRDRPRRGGSENWSA